MAAKKQLRALVVEDSEDDYEILLLELRRGGYELVTERVETSDGLIAALDRQPWDIVFCDWSLPRFSASAALAVLKEKSPDLPLIILSGTVGEDVAVEALRTGARDFLIKDRMARLVPAIERELGEAGVRQERNRMQEQIMISDRMASVGIIAAGVAHEINNPLAAVLANLELADRTLQGMLTARAENPALRVLRAEVADALEAAERIRKIARDLKVFSRVDDDERGPVDVRRVLESSLRIAWTEVHHRARLVENYGDVAAVEANEARLGQVFLNLVINAAQSIPEGRAEENEIGVVTRTRADGRVLVEIRDSGSGMAPDVLKRLFTPFFTTKPVGVGSGLGLSICHRLVTSFGGEISVESVVGKGSVFRVSLPPARPQVAVPPAAGSAAPSGAPAVRGSVLVVDDEELITSIVRRGLEEEHDVVAVHRARDALARVEAGERFDVILCDLMMPEMTGMELHAELLRIAPDQAEKMVFMTGGAFTAGARAFLERVAADRIDKPFHLATLRSVVHDRLK